MGKKHAILTFTLLALAMTFNIAHAQTQYKVLSSIYAADNDKRVHNDSIHVLKGIVLNTNSNPIDQVFIYLSFTSKGNPDIEWIGSGAFHANEKGEFSIAVADSMENKEMKLVFVSSGYENQEINFTMDEMPCYQYVQMIKIKESGSPDDHTISDTFGFTYINTTDPEQQRDLDITKTQMGFNTFKPFEDRNIETLLPPPSFMVPFDKR